LYRFGAFIVQPGYSEVLGFRDEGVDLERFRDVFFRLVAPWLVNRKVWDCLHASAVLSESGVLIFCGPSGRGKSTLARVCCEHGATRYADDAVPFLIRDGVPMAAHIPQRLRLRHPAASWFGETPSLPGTITTTVTVKSFTIWKKPCAPLRRSTGWSGGPMRASARFR
jgi:hypothetical protein